ncbi:MAG: hemolysin III family protein [Anaerolineaceae bacterium]|nr:hemolysin III family protein [Anaerolineaceae bacterium]
MNQPWYQKLRDPVSGLTHLAAALIAALGTGIVLVSVRGDGVRMLALLIYGLSLVFLLSASATYHLVSAPPRAALALRKMDHAAIYALIAGSYTPFCLVLFAGFWRWGLLAMVWAMALTGIGVKIFVIQAPRWVTTGVYLLMGWLSVLAAGEMLRTLPTAGLVWLALGGASFTVGAVIYILKRPNLFPGVFGFHELWHIFVILGCLSHFIAIVISVAPVGLLP